MNSQTNAAIIAIAIVIPLLSIAVWGSEQGFMTSIGSKSSSETAGAHQPKIDALTSFSVLYEFTNEIGGKKVDVLLLVPSGVEPHDWEPTIHDLQKIQQSDLIIINGIGFENWLLDVKLVNSDVVIVDTSKGILSPISQLPSPIQTNHQTQFSDASLSDPHIWLNPVMAKKQVANIAQALIEVDPQNEDYYKKNVNSYIEKLDLLDTKITNELSGCKKDFIVYHNSFSYFADQYGLSQHSIINSNEPHQEPTSQILEQVINLARELEIDVIFTEESVDSRSSQVIADEIGGRVLTLSPLEVSNTVENISGNSISSDSSDTSYIKKMEQNLVKLKEALC